MNFTFQRNPERLLDLCGLSPIRDRRQEKLFMEKAAALEAQDLRPLVLVIGGFLDQILGNSYAVSARYPADLRAKHDVWFREHYESRKMRDIVNIYASKGHSVALIGHSWGRGRGGQPRRPQTQCAHRSAHQPRSRIAQGSAPPEAPQRPPLAEHPYRLQPEHMVRHPQSRGPHRRPWEAAENADVNVSCPPDMTHAWAWGMFERYGEKVLRERAEGWK